MAEQGRGVCPVNDCGRPLKTLRSGLCDTHYRQKAAGKPFTAIKAVSPGGMWGEWYVAPNGYVYRSGRFDGKHRNQAQHRVIMAEVLGRPLKPSETPHHKNGVRHDNRPENLELWVKSQPAGQRAVDLLAWAREIIETYEPLEGSL